MAIETTGPAEPLAFPAELRALGQWICWRYEEKDGRVTKIPYDPRSGRRASSTNPATWTTYEQACAAAGRYDGVGFVFARGGGVVGIDMDRCVGEDGVLTESDQRIVRAFDTYTEFSPSRTGVHLFVRGGLPPGKRRRGRYEIYEEGRYFTVTGERVPGTPATVAARQPEIDRFHEWIAGRDEDDAGDPVPRPTPITAYAAQIDDVDLLERARRAKNGELFEALWRGDLSGYGGDHSGADLALCNLLGFWTGGDPVRVDRLFRLSGLMRPKWDERRGETTYGDRTIDVAIRSLQDVYEPGVELGRIVWRGRDGRAVRIDAETGEVLEAEETTAGEAPRFVVHWAAEALEPQPPIPWTVENVAAPGMVVVWYGAGGTLKTYALLDMLVHVALGLEWVGFAVTAGPALIVDEESGPRRLRRRLGEVMRQHGADAGLNLAFVSLSALNLRDDRDAAHLEALVAQLRPSVVLVDALIDVTPGADENASGDVQPAFNVLRRIAEAHDTSFHVIHHANKAGGYRGSTAIRAAVDLMVLVERVKGSDRVTLATDKTRDTEPFQLTLQPHFETDGVDRTFDVERVEDAARAQPVTVSRFTAAEGCVVRFLLGRKGGATMTEIVAARGDDVDDDTVRRTVHRLRRSGVLVRADDGGSGHVGVYELVDFDNPRRLMEMLDG